MMTRRPSVQPIRLLVIDRHKLPAAGGARTAYIVAQLRKAALVALAGNRRGMSEVARQALALGLKAMRTQEEGEKKPGR